MKFIDKMLLRLTDSIHLFGLDILLRQADYWTLLGQISVKDSKSNITNFEHRCN